MSVVTIATCSVLIISREMSSLRKSSYLNIGIYLTCIMAITTLAMVATVFVGNLYEMNDRPVPPWARRVLMAHIARILCIFDCAQDDWKLYDETSKEREEKEEERRSGEAFHLVTIFNPYTSSAPRHHICRRSSTESTTENRNDETLLRHHRSIDRRSLRIAKEKDHVTKSISGPLKSSSQAKKTSSDFVSLISGTIPALGAVPAVPLVPAQALAPVLALNPAPVAVAIGKGGSNFSRDWSHVAAVCDRFFFWLCLVFIVVTTLLLFHPLSTSRFFRIPVLYRTSK